LCMNLTSTCCSLESREYVLPASSN
jgi:hypothetical protein